jgi:hypothetical protein
MKVMGAVVKPLQARPPYPPHGGKSEQLLSASSPDLGRPPSICSKVHGHVRPLKYIYSGYSRFVYPLSTLLYADNGFMRSGY